MGRRPVSYPITDPALLADVLCGYCTLYGFSRTFLAKQLGMSAPSVCELFLPTKGRQRLSPRTYKALSDLAYSGADVMSIQLRDLLLVFADATPRNHADKPFIDRRCKQNE
jgi:hypothetical protein